MDKRLFFVLGDLLANIVVGATVAWLTWLIVSTGWNMWLTMFVMMFFGMIIATILFFPFGYFFGAMEVMLPTMLTGMLSGMVVSMRCTMHTTSASYAIFLGAVCGLGSIVAVWILNNHIFNSSNRESKQYG